MAGPVPGASRSRPIAVTTVAPARLLADPIELPIIGAVGAGVDHLLLQPGHARACPTKTATVVAFAIVGDARARRRRASSAIQRGTSRTALTGTFGLAAVALDRRWSRSSGFDGRARDPRPPHARRHRRGGRVRSGGDRGRRARQSERRRPSRASPPSWCSTAPRSHYDLSGLRRCSPPGSPAALDAQQHPVPQRVRRRRPAGDRDASAARRRTTSRSAPSGLCTPLGEPGSVQFLTLNFAPAQLGRRRRLRSSPCPAPTPRSRWWCRERSTDPTQKARTAEMPETFLRVRRVACVSSPPSSPPSGSSACAQDAPAGHVAAGRRRTPRRSRTSSGGCS